MADKNMEIENIELQRQMLKETQRLHEALSDRQSVKNTNQPKPISSKPIENRNKVGENRMGLPTPLPVVITDETGSDKKSFNEMIQELEKTQKANLKEIESENKRRKVSEDLQIKRDQEVQRLTREQNEVTLLSNRQRILEASRENKFRSEQRGIWQRVYDISKKEGAISGLLTGLPRAFSGVLKDKISGSLRETVGAPLQLLALKEGKLSQKFEKNFEEQSQYQKELFDSMQDDKAFRKKLDLEKQREKNIITQEEFEQALEEIEIQRQKDYNRSFSRQERVFLDESRNRNSLLNSILEVMDKESKTTYTQEEREKNAHTSVKLMSNVLTETEERNKLFYSLSDPKGKSMNVRITDVKGGLKLGGKEKSEKKEEGGLLDWLFKGVGSIFKNFGSILSTGVKTIGGLITKLGPATLLLGKGLLVAGAAYAGWKAGSYIADKVIKYRREMRKEEAQSFTKKFRAAGNQAELKRQAAGISKEDFFKIREQSREGDVKALQQSLSKLNQEQRDAVLSELRAESKQKELIARREREKFRTNLNPFATKEVFDNRKLANEQWKKSNEAVNRLQATLGKLPEDIQTEVQKTVLKKALKETKIEIEKTSRPTIGLGEDPLLSEVKGLRKSLEKIFGDSAKENQNIQSTYETLRMAQNATTSPLTVPDNILSRVPQASEQMGTIKP